MNTELEIWHFAAERLHRNETVMLLVVAESSGSSPGRQGFKMVVAADEMRGSIGGGVMEIALVEKAKERITNYELRITNEIIEQVHRKNSEHSSGMICSGRQTVVLCGLNNSHLGTIEKIISAIENDEPAFLRMSNCGFEILADSVMVDFGFQRQGASKFSYTEKLGYKNKLFIIGGGHCALALSEIMSKMDFYISLFDDRKDLNTLAKNEFVDEKNTIESYEKIGEFIEGGDDKYVVIMTLGYKFDEIVIRKLFDKDFKYFGVLGSRAKMKTLLKNLEKENFDKEKLARIRTPIGLKINSQTPFEIAVSIAAEIIQIKNS